MMFKLIPIVIWFLWGLIPWFLVPNIFLLSVPHGSFEIKSNCLKNVWPKACLIVHLKVLRLGHFSKIFKIIHLEVLTELIELVIILLKRVGRFLRNESSEICHCLLIIKLWNNFKLLLLKGIRNVILPSWWKLLTSSRFHLGSILRSRLTEICKRIYLFLSKLRAWVIFSYLIRSGLLWLKSINLLGLL